MCQLVDGEEARWRCSPNCDSGMLPTNSTVSLITVFGTPRMAYRSARCGNSFTSTTSATIRGFSIAILWANLATGGQYGQVGVTKKVLVQSLQNLHGFLG